MAGEGDFVDAFLHHWYSLFPASKDKRLQAEILVRSEFGGRRVYIRKSRPATLATARTAAQIDAGATIAGQDRSG